MTVLQIVALLNEAVAIDPVAVCLLIEKRVLPTNKAILRFEQHPTIVPDSSGQIGVLGLINGIVGLDGELIEAVYNDHNDLIKFRLREKKECPSQ